MYGGNSGGPILIENTLDVIGLPFTYWPNLYTPVPALGAHSFEELAGFVGRNRGTLVSHGITVSGDLARTGGTFAFLNTLPVGSHFRRATSGCDLEMGPRDANGTLTTIDRDLDGSGDCHSVGQTAEWKCETDAGFHFCLRQRGSEYSFIHRISGEPTGSFSVAGTGGPSVVYQRE